MYFFNKISFQSFFIIIIAFSSCDHSPNAPSQQFFSDISVIVQNEGGKPIKGVLVGTYPATARRFTNESGRATIEQIPVGNYQLILTYPTLPLFYRDVILTANKTLEETFTVASQVSIYVVVNTFAGEPVSDVEVSTYPPTRKKETDENGRVLLENVPLQQYTFIVGRSNTTVRVPERRLIIRNGVLDDIIIVIGSQEPLVHINSPSFDSYHSNLNVNLVGEGYDFEDGVLLDNSLTWYSSIDGELGAGRELTVDYLSFGKQTITLIGTDSDNNQTERFVVIHLYYFEEESYFPIPWQGYWNYSYPVPSFSVINNKGETEEWVLTDVMVSIDDVNSRKSRMNYTVKSGNDNVRYQYEVVDYFQADLDNIYVEKTTELLKMWENTKEIYEPTEQMNIETVYSPSYLIIKNHKNPSNEDDFNTSVTGDVTWYYENVFLGSLQFHETVSFVASIEIGESEMVETELGVFEAVPLTITSGNSAKIWWLSKGIGLIKLEYNIADYPQFATLNETNIFTYAEDILSKKVLENSYRSVEYPLLRQFKTQPNTHERTLEIIRLLRDISPR